MPPISRRAMLKAFAGGATLSAATPLITACSGDNASPEVTAQPELPQSANFDDLTGFDYPIIKSLLPFAHGVASGDPMQDRVIIWTRITIPDPRGWEVTDPQGITDVMVDWVIATDPDLNNIVNRGTASTSAARDFTVKVDAHNLQPATTYYYAFAALGETSIVGRTRTAPDASSQVDELRFAVVACSSYWSSYWSGYGHIADRNDLDLVIHVGDYIYDFVDQDEEVRARVDDNGDVKNDITDVDYRTWLNKNELRRRYALFRSEPNHLRSHQQHPWTIVWDNHDIEPDFGNELDDSAVDRSGEDPNFSLKDTVDVFWEWTPCRPPVDLNGNVLTVDDGSYPEPLDAFQVWRKLDYGPLADILCLDIELYRQQTDAERPTDHSDHLANGESLLGMDQYNYVTSQMLASKNASKTWRVLPHQTWLAPWNIPSPDSSNSFPADTPVQTRWANFTEERAQWFQFLRDNDIANNIVLSGDMHGNWASDLIENNALSTPYQPGSVIANPRNGSFAANVAAGYGRGLTTTNSAISNTRSDSVGVEFAPTSMGRGGADELVANANPGSTVADQVAGARAIELATINGNKNVQFKEWVDHGYGIVHITADEAVFEFWWQDKLTENSPDLLGYQMVAFAIDDTTAVPVRYRNQIDDVTVHGRTVAASNGNRQDMPAPTPTSPLVQV